MRPLAPAAVLLGGILAAPLLAPPLLAEPNVQETTGGPPLAAGEQTTSSAQGAIAGDAAAKNLPTVDHAFANADGIPQPDAANQSPGHDRLTTIDRKSTLVTSNGAIRVARLIGSELRSGTGNSLGTIRDVLLSAGQAPKVVVDVDGKLVAIPFGKLVFGTPGSESRGKAVLPDGTRHGLKQLPAFSFRNAADRG
jgi:hypothetical protein